MLKGYLGASSENGHTRIYFDPHLASYAEIPSDAILHTADAAAADGPAATNVWIKRDAQLIYGTAGSSRPRGTFLEGSIMQANMAGTTAAPQAFFPSLFQACPTHPVSACAHPTLEAIATITWQGYPCHTYTPGCGGRHPTMMAAIATITSQGQVCHTHLVNCGGGGPHTM